jgi:hypothetical protein
VPSLPDAPFAAVLDRLDATWAPWTAPHMFILAMSGAGKTTLIRQILGYTCAPERALVLDPKPADDPSWSDGGWAPAPVTAVAPRFGEDHDGGGPAGLWYRLTASHDPGETARRFTAALRLVQAEGHTVLVLDDAHELCLGLKLRDQIDSVLTLGRSAGISCIVASGDTGYVPRSQAAFKFAGQISGIDAAKAAARLVGQRGRDWEDTILSLESFGWLYFDNRPGFPGPCRFTAAQAAVAV